MNANRQQTRGRTQVAAVFPAPKPQQTVVVVPEQKPFKNCCPVLSKGCDLFAGSCGDFYFNPICQSVGITGMLYARPCLVYDEQWGGAGECIGCKKDCDNNICPRYY